MNDQEVLKPLAERVLELSAQPIQEAKKKMWADHQALKKAGRIPVSVFYEGIPRPQWDLMLGKDHSKCSTATGKELEFFFRRVIWMAETVPDDHIVWPLAKLTVPMIGLQDWGVRTEMVSPEDELGAKASSEPLKDWEDLSKLRKPLRVVDRAAWDRKAEEAHRLLGGTMGLYPYFPNMDFSPFDVAANMRGLGNIMLDPFDDPDKLHALMEFLLEAYVEHHLEREKNGWINFAPDAQRKYQPVLESRVHCAHVPDEAKSNSAPRLRYEWAYISAQTSSGFGPEMYREFVHEYNVRLARLFPLHTVYYHGCEPLDQKAETIMSLPHLRRFHVSPWSSLPAINNVVRGRAVLEVHSHPAKVLLSWHEDEMRAELRRLVSEAEGQPMDLNLSDIHSLNGNPSTLGLWARIAKEETEGHPT